MVVVQKNQEHQQMCHSQSGRWVGRTPWNTRANLCKSGGAFFAKQAFGHKLNVRQNHFMLFLGLVAQAFLKPPKTHQQGELLLYRGRPPQG